MGWMGWAVGAGMTGDPAGIAVIVREDVLLAYVLVGAAVEMMDVDTGTFIMAGKDLFCSFTTG
jgi:hypothetical protein